MSSFDIFQVVEEMQARLCKELKIPRPEEDLFKYVQVIATWDDELLITAKDTVKGYGRSYRFRSVVTSKQRANSVERKALKDLKHFFSAD